MNGPNSWLKVIHATTCDEPALERVVNEALACGPALRLMGAPPHGDPLLYWRRIGEAAAGGACDGRAWTPLRGEAPGALHSEADVADGDIDILYMERPARHGGELLLIDAEAVAAWTRDQDPILHDGLFGLPLLFSDGARRPVLQPRGERLTIRWQPGRIAPGQGGAVSALCAAFTECLEDLEAEGLVAGLRLHAGDALFLRPDQLLQGAYGRAGSERILWRTRLRRQAQTRRRAAA